MSTSKRAAPRRHPLRTLLLLAVLVGIIVAIKNAIADKGGTYAAPTGPTVVPTPDMTGATSGAEAAVAEAEIADAPVAAPPAAAPKVAKAKVGPAAKVVTAEEIVEAHPKETLDDFAVPVAHTQPVDGPAGDADPAGNS